jgi:hypothetical protein
MKKIGIPLIALLLTAMLGSCAGTRRAGCPSCPNFRGSRAIYGGVDSPQQHVNPYYTFR